MKTYRNFIGKLEKKIYAPIYLLWGEENFYIDKITEYFEKNILTESEKDFNFTALYGRDTSVEEIINICRRFPMRANYQLVILKEAQMLKQIDKLSVYTSTPMNSTILVISYKGKVDRRKKFFQDINKKFITFESSPVKGEKIDEWIVNYLSEKGFTITEKATSMLSEFIGNNLSNLTNELDKLTILITNTKKITEDHIEKNIGISKIFNTFELLNAIGKRNQYKSFFIANYMSRNSKKFSLIETIVYLYNHFSKMLVYYTEKKKKSDNRTIAANMGISTYHLRNYADSSRFYPVNKLIENISLLREYDMKSKGVNNMETEQSELLKELIYRLMN